MLKILNGFLTCFELMSGMRINYNKSEIVPTNPNDGESTKQFAGVLGAL
jgi:hypothetical protein